MRILNSVIAIAIALNPFASLAHEGHEHAKPTPEQEFEFQKKFYEARANQIFQKLKTLHNLIDAVSLRATDQDKAFLAKLKKNVSNRQLPSMRRDGHAVYFSGHETPFLVGSSRPLALKYNGNSWSENPSASLEETLTSMAKAFLKSPKETASVLSLFTNYAHASGDDWDREVNELKKRNKKSEKEFEKVPAMFAQGILATVLIAAGGIGLLYGELAGKALGGISMIAGLAMFPKSANAAEVGGTQTENGGSFEIVRHECKKDRLVTHFKTPDGKTGTTETVVNKEGRPVNYSFFFAGDSKPKYQYFLDGSADKPDWKIVGKSPDAPDQSSMVDMANLKFQKVLWDMCTSTIGAIDALNKAYSKFSGAPAAPTNSKPQPPPSTGSTQTK